MFIVSAKKKTADKKSFAPLPKGKSVAGATAAAILGIGTVRAVKKIRRGTVMWNDHYRGDTFAYGTQPNSFHEEHSKLLNGPVLSLAEAKAISWCEDWEAES